MKGDRYHIECSEEQLSVIINALETYGRLGMGQLEVAVEEFIRKHFYKDYYEEVIEVLDKDNEVVDTKRKGKAVEELIYKVKDLVWKHPPHGSWGIANTKVPKECRESYDILQVLRKTRAERRASLAKNEYPYTVDWTYHATNPDLPPVHCKISDAMSSVLTSTAALFVPCRKCNAAAREACKDEQGYGRVTHVQRRLDWDEVRNSLSFSVGVELPAPHRVAVFDRTKVERGTAWDKTKARNRAMTAKTNPWRKAHTEHFWVWYDIREEEGSPF